VTDDDVSRMNARIGAYAGTGKPELPDGIDWFEHLQKPDLPKTSDPLARFVTARIIEAETEPRSEIRPLYDQPGGAMAHRYAKHVRADCVVFRRITMWYLRARQELDEAEHPAARSALGLKHAGISEAMREVACRWSDHREFDEAWRLT
jgi:hypothetical protein